jgi:hypothetical protein
MDQLLSIAGGQPLHANDWSLIQNQEMASLSAIIGSVIGNATACILTGLMMTNDGTKISITEGYIFIGGEIFYVPAVLFAINNDNTLYFVQDFSTTENRTFKDTTTHDVYAYRRYKILYQAIDPGLSVQYTIVASLLTILTNFINTNIPSANLSVVQHYAYSIGFTPATAFSFISLQGNALNGYMLEAAFNASVTQGKLCTLEVGMRPSADLVGFFYNNSVAPGILKIKKNGDIYISGASTTSPNYITFQFYMNFVDEALFSLPTTGGGLPDVDR